MNNNKEAERAELHKTIWRIANDLRGSVDGWDFKSYVLGMLFYRFISENLAAYLNSQERKAGDTKFDYAALPDNNAEQGRAETVREKEFYILLIDGFSKIRIPVHPLKKQERIVAILDISDALVNDLSSGLPAEIKTRRQQYEY